MRELEKERGGGREGEDERKNREREKGRRKGGQAEFDSRFFNIIII